MLWFVTRRLMWMLLTLWIVFTISFILMRIVPGGPYSRERKVPDEILRNLERRYHLDEHPTIQYGRELWNFVCLDPGPSFGSSDFTVGEIIRQGFPVSASLGVMALAFALALGLSTGIVSAVWRGSAADVGLRTLATVGIAVPNFVVAGVLIMLTVFIVPIFPAGGWEGPQFVVLPVICLGAPYAAYIARLSRTGMLDVLGQDYIRTAYAKGLHKRTVILRHALKGALMPVVSYLGPATAGLLTGSIVIEQIFAVPGLGMHFIESATQRDYTLSMGLILLFTLILSTMNLLVDLAYLLLDPRIKLS